MIKSISGFIKTSLKELNPWHNIKLLHTNIRGDILAGIAQAGGFTQLARTSKIELTRDGKTETFDLNDLKKVKDIKKKIWLQAADQKSHPIRD